MKTPDLKKINWKEMIEVDRNALVAKEVLKLDVRKETWGCNNQYFRYSIGKPDYYDDRGELILFNPVKNYSTDPEAAMEVLESLRSKYPNIVIESHFGNCWSIYKNSNSQLDADDLATAASLPEAICLAALKIMGIMV